MEDRGWRGERIEDRCIERGRGYAFGRRGVSWVWEGGRGGVRS